MKCHVHRAKTKETWSEGLKFQGFKFELTKQYGKCQHQKCQVQRKQGQTTKIWGAAFKVSGLILPTQNSK